MKMEIKRIFYYLKHLILGNYCEKCERCIYFWKDPYNGLDVCDFHFTHNRHSNIIKGEFNQIVDCKDFEEKNRIMHE